MPLWRSYLAGCILLGVAPCTAMVLVWGYLARGNDGLTLVMVAINSLTMLVLYGVLGGFLLGVGRLPVPWQALLLSIGIYVALPLVAGYFSRKWIIAAKGETWFKDKFLHVLTPITIAALLITLVLLFSFKGEVIAANPLTILWIAVPLFVQTMLIFALGYGLARLLKLSLRGRRARGHDRRLQSLRGRHRHRRDAVRAFLRCSAGHGGRRADRGAGDADAGGVLQADGALVSADARASLNLVGRRASHFFELAVAAAISLFGFQLGAALATVVGVPIDVPVMLLVVKVVNASKDWCEAGALAASERAARA